MFFLLQCLAKEKLLKKFFFLFARFFFWFIISSVKKERAKVYTTLALLYFIPTVKTTHHQHYNLWKKSQNIYPNASTEWVLNGMLFCNIVQSAKRHIQHTHWARVDQSSLIIFSFFIPVFFYLLVSIHPSIPPCHIHAKI